MFKWEAPQEEAFVTLRDALCKEPILQYPDYTKEFNVTTDALGYAIGGVFNLRGNRKGLTYSILLETPQHSREKSFEY